MSATGKAAVARAAAGFTLIEMLVVLGIAGLIAGLGFPQLQGQMAAQEFRSSVAGTMAALRSARAAAIRSGGVASVSLGPGGRVLRIDGRDSVTLPASVRAAMAAPLHFASDGSSTGGAIGIIGSNRSVSIDVAPATGLLLVRASATPG